MHNYWETLDDSLIGREVVQDIGHGTRQLLTETPLGAAFAAWLGPMLAAGYGGGAAGAAASGATIGAGNAALSGGNLLRGGLQGGLQSYIGGEFGGDAGAGGADVSLESPGMIDGGGEFLKATSSTPAFTTLDASGTPISSTPAMTDVNVGTGPLQVPVQTNALPGGMLNLDGMSELDQTDEMNRDALEAGDVPPATPAEQSLVNPKTIAKIALAVSKMLGSDAPDAPQRDEGESDADYAQELVEYLSLDAEAMAAQGLVPGSQEYYDYIMQQADAVIAQLMGDEAEDYSEQLRTKTQEELRQLQRALYVRGQLDLMMGSGQYADPLSGNAEDVVTPGMLFNPSQAAYQRGLARNTDTLASMRGDDARGYLQGLLNRDFDPFNMQAEADDRYAQALLEENQDDDELRRRRMFSN
jgi:hypothetical protein